MADTIIVIPSYNEAERLPAGEIAAWARRYPLIHFQMVDDGSRDGTGAVLAELAQKNPGSISVFSLPHNCGKAEAVRQGCLAAFQKRPELVGYWDADLATPLDAIVEFRRVLTSRAEIDLVLGSRMPLLGRHIDRTSKRQILGRAFATAAARFLRLPIYDTQCGAKLFRNTARIQQAFAEPFLSRWIFDVELLARFGAAGAGEAIYELPLETWRDVSGSKLRRSDSARAMFDMARLWWHYDTRRPQPVEAVPLPRPAHTESPLRRSA